LVYHFLQAKKTDNHRAIGIKFFSSFWGEAKFNKTQVTSTQFDDSQYKYNNAIFNLVKVFTLKIRIKITNNH
jgi:hypothetical protein